MTKHDYISDAALLKQMPVFYQPWFLDIFGVEWDVLCLDTSASRWIFPYFKERKFIFSFSRPQVFQPYYGPFRIDKANPHWKPDPSEMKALIQLMKQNAQIVLLPFTGFEFSVLQKMGFSAKPRVTYILDLEKTEEALLLQVEKKHRRSILKGREELGLIEGAFDVATMVLWMQQAYEKRGDAYRIDPELVKKYVETVLAHDAGIALTAVDSRGAARSMILVLLDPGGENAYYMIAANSFTEPHNAANTYLLWESILRAKRRGYKRFDFEGSSIPGIARFFAKFGGVATPFFSWQATNSVLWKWKQKLLG